MTIPYSIDTDGGESLPPTDGVPTGYSLFYDASAGIAKWGQSSISTTGAQDLDILTYKSSTNKIVWSSASINLKNFITQSATPQLYGTFFGTAAGDKLGSCDIATEGNYIVLGYNEATQTGDASTDKRGLVRVYQATDKTNDTWEQVGGDIYGSTTTSQIGKQVAIAHDNPNRIAIREENPACVRVYEYSGGTWSINSTVSGYPGTTFLVANFEVNSAGDNNIHAVRLSNDGNRLVMSDITNNVGKLVVYDYISSSSTWTPTDIVHPYSVNDTDRYGFDVDMAGDGNRIFVGFPVSRDLVRIVDFVNGAWSWGTSFAGDPGTETGHSVAISRDGTTIAYAQATIDLQGVSQMGRITIKRYNDQTDAWDNEQVFNGDQANAKLGIRHVDGGIYHGSVLSLSDDGRRLAIGNPLYDNSNTDKGRVRIYDKSPTTNLWSVSGSGTSQSNTFINILGDNEANAYFGGGVAMSSDGMHLIAVGPYDDNTSGTNAGIAKAYILPEALSSGTVFYNTDGILRIAP